MTSSWVPRPGTHAVGGDDVALTITATVDATSRAVRLTITGGTPEYVVQAAPGGDRLPYTVRSTYSPLSGDPTGRVAVDGDAPLNTPVQYVVTDKAGDQAQTAVVTVASDLPVLADAMDPSRAMAVLVVSQPPNTWEARSVWWDVLGQREPFVSVAPLRLRSGDVVFRVASLAERTQLVSIMASGHPLVLRSTCPDAVDDVIMLPATVEDALVMDDAPGGPRNVTVSYQAVARELGPYVLDPGRSYASLPAESATYGDVRAKFTDYRALLSGDPYAGMGPDVIVNGSFTAGLSGWGTFWTSGASLDTSAGTALVTADASANGYANIDQGVTGPDGLRVLRVTGRVRSTSPATGVYVQLWSNTLPDPAQPFAPGVALTQQQVRPGPAWVTFTADLSVPNAAHDTVAVFLRCDAMPLGAQVEWDDVAARWLT